MSMGARLFKPIIIVLAIATAAVFFWPILSPYFDRPPGDFETEMGSNRLEDGRYEQALEQFDTALQLAPNHRGALMGRALVFIQTEQYDDAIAELDYLIETLSTTLAPDDSTGLATLASAHANRGIVNDRIGQYENALADYIEALKIDEDTVDGPGIIHKILYGADDLSTVRDRAQYLYEQLALPESERLLRVPELDEAQRMYKP